MARLGDYINIRTGKLDANASSEDGQYPFFTCSVNSLRIDTYSYDCECALVAGNGDLNVKYYNGKFNAYQRTYIIESKDKSILSVPYLYYFLDRYVEELRKQSIGGVIKYIKIGNLTEARIPMRSILEQGVVVVNLKKVNDLITLRKRQLSKLDELVKSRFVEMFGEPTINSKGWPVARLSELGELNRGVSKARPRNSPDLLGGPYPLVQTGEVANSGLYIRHYNATYSEKGLAQSRLWNSGTLCITIAANIAQTSILTFDACFPDSVVGFVANERTNSVFVHFWFTFFQRILESQAPQVAQKNINLKILSELNVITPPLALQQEFAAFVEKVDKLEFKAKASLEKLETLKKAMMQKYFG